MDQDTNIEFDEGTEPTEAENQSDAPNGAPETNAGQVDSEDASDIAEAETTDDESTPETQPTEIEKAEAAFKKKINRYAWHRKEEERKREAAEQRAKELENQLKAYNEQKAQIKIPPMPDPLDDDFLARMQDRERAIRMAAAYDAEQKFLADQQQKQQQQAFEKAQQEAAEKTRKVYDSAVKYGIDQDQLKVAEDRLASFIPRNQNGVMLADHILEHEKSPLIIKYLGDNAAEAEKIAGMNPIAAAMYINDTVLKNAEKLKPALTKAPEPVKSPSGRGAPKAQNRFLEGVVME